MARGKKDEALKANRRKCLSTKRKSRKNGKLCVSKFNYPVSYTNYFFCDRIVPGKPASTIVEAEECSGVPKYVYNIYIINQSFLT